LNTRDGIAGHARNATPSGNATPTGVAVAASRHSQPETARRLRGEGVQLREIAERLGVARSTVWDWTADIAVPDPECVLCGDPFPPGPGGKRFCCPAHAGKHWKVFGPVRRRLVA
jgi:hypothetical protein